MLGFPCDQFGNQEPGSEDEIAEFCETSYGVTFPMFAKIDVNGADTHPLYSGSRARRRPACPSAARSTWNFAKFLSIATAHVLDRFKPMTRPEPSCVEDIEKALAAE